MSDHAPLKPETTPGEFSYSWDPRQISLDEPHTLAELSSILRTWADYFDGEAKGGFMLDATASDYQNSKIEVIYAGKKTL